MKLLICIQTIEKVYTGGIAVHNQAKCNECQKKQPCQYAVEDGEFFKVGPTTINRGDHFTEYEVNSDYVRLISNRDEEGNYLTHDISIEQFQNCFQHPRVRIGYVGNPGMIAKNEAAQILFWNNANVVTMHTFKDS